MPFELNLPTNWASIIAGSGYAIVSRIMMHHNQQTAVGLLCWPTCFSHRARLRRSRRVSQPDYFPERWATSQLSAVSPALRGLLKMYLGVHVLSEQPVALVLESSTSLPREAHPRPSS
jgi:hypothetical protein